MAGRPTKLTPELMARYLAVLPTVYFLETAADLVGVSRWSVHRWMVRGEKALRSGRNGSETIYREFCTAARKVVAEKLQTHVKSAATFAKKDAKVLLWIIEKTAPDLWGDQRAKIAEQEKRIAALEKKLASRA